MLLGSQGSALLERGNPAAARLHFEKAAAILRSLLPSERDRSADDYLMWLLESQLSCRGQLVELGTYDELVALLLQSITTEPSQTREEQLAWVLAHRAWRLRQPDGDDVQAERDLTAMAEAITDQTRMVFVCNPNNPTGTSLRRAELDRFLANVPQDVLVVLDEAYREFVTDGEVPDGLAAYGDRPNVVVLRTLSKAWGLAGLRVGFLIAQPEVATAVRKVATPFGTSLTAQTAAIAALAQEAEVRRRCALVIAERDRVTEAVCKLVPDVPTSQANFVWLPLGTDSAAFANVCESRGVIVRPVGNYNLPRWLRVTIGLPEENAAFIAALERALA